MKNLGEMMKQVQDMQARMEELQEKLNQSLVTGQSGGGLVKVTLNGKGALTATDIDASLLKPEEKEILEDLLVAAHADARAKVESLMADHMKQMTGGLALPPGLKAAVLSVTRRSTGPEIERLIQALAKLPGLGPRSARRAALHLIKNRDKLLVPLAAAMAEARDKVTVCATCGNVDTVDPCTLCADPRRDPSIICVVEEVGDLWALERANAWSGFYHVLGGTLSAIEGVRPEDLAISSLIERAARPGVKEVVLAVNATVEGQTTAHYITERLKGLGVQTSRLAHGVPVGGELDYLDEGTLTQAMRARRPF